MQKGMHGGCDGRAGLEIGLGLKDPAGLLAQAFEQRVMLGMRWPDRAEWR